MDRVVMIDASSRSIIATGRPVELVDSPDPRVQQFFNRQPGSRPAASGV
jgi:hypothetical protein